MQIVFYQKIQKKCYNKVFNPWGSGRINTRSESESVKPKEKEKFDHIFFVGRVNKLVVSTRNMPAKFVKQEKRGYPLSAIGPLLRIKSKPFSTREGINLHVLL